MLDRLFAADALDPAVGELRAALEAGASAVNDDDAVADVLGGLADDLRRLGLVDEGERPEFEVGAVSQRELLQSLRLALPAQGVQIPLFRQGRGAQRLLLVSVLLRLATAGTATPIAGFEEPEEALEPLRQAQLAEMLIDLADGGGQIFVVTHSPEIARAFEIEDFILLQERAAGANTKQLRVELSAQLGRATNGGSTELSSADCSLVCRSSSRAPATGPRLLSSGRRSRNRSPPRASRR